MELGQWLGYDMSGQYDMDDGLLPTGAEPGDKFLFLDSLARVRCETVRQAWEQEGFGMNIMWQEQERFSEGYAKYKDNSGMLDFTDMLLQYAESGLPVNARVAFIDEAQDLSRAQWHVLQRAFGGAEQVIIAGDDDQSIYKWSGADLETFLGLEGTQEVLHHSYRLPRRVYRAANRIIHQVKGRYTKEFTPRDADGEVGYVMMMEQAEINPDETTMILVRNVYLLKGVYDMLRLRGLTYVGRHGYTSVKQDHVKAIVAWEHLRKGNVINLDQVKAIYEYLRVGTTVARGGKAKVEDSDDYEAPFAWETLRDHYGLITIAPHWFEALEGIPRETREYYLSVLRSNRRISTPPTIYVNTIHGVKGGQADHVIILSDMSKRTFTEMDRDPDSEHRVAFVALTRAKERVTIVEPSGKFSYPYWVTGA
jgi:superfamily I DNA/RNA helicase